MNDGHGGIDPSAGGPYRDGMDVRVALLEDRWSRIDGTLKSMDDRMKSIEEGLRRVEIEVAEVKGRVYSLPSTWAVITTVIGGQIAFSGLVFAVAVKLMTK